MEGVRVKDEDLLDVVKRALAIAEERGGPATHNVWALLDCFRAALQEHVDADTGPEMPPYLKMPVIIVPQTEG